MAGLSEQDVSRTGGRAGLRTGLPARLAGWLDGAIEAATAVLLVATCLIAILQVFFRYVLNNSLPWPEELARFAFVWVVFAGMAIGIHRDNHLRIDILDQRVSPALRAALGFVSRTAIAMACIVLVVHGLDLFGRATTVSPALEWPVARWYLAVPAGAALGLVFVAIAPPGRMSWWSGLAAVVCGGILYLAFTGPLSGLLGALSTSGTLIAVGLVLVVLGVPLAFAMVLAVFAAFVPKNPIILVTISQNMTSTIDSFVLMAIPFFITAAAVMNAGGITERLVELATRLVGHLRGGLGHVNVLTNTMMAGVSGSSMADAASIGKIMVPAMEKRGYPRPFSCALTSASSVIANLIPPSLGLIIYGALASVSVGALFVATIVPGLMVAAALAIVVALLSFRSGYGADTAAATGPERRQAFVVALPALILPVLIVGGVRFGVFTATEAGATAFLYAVFCGAVFYRVLTAKRFVAAIREALHDTIAVMVVIAAASPFAWVLASEQVPQKIGLALGGIAENPVLLLLLINLLLLGVGLFMEMIAAMVILVPILVPLIISAGIDPIHFGIVIIINLVIGALTPPLGMLVFTTARVGDVPASQVFRAVVPFLVAMVVVLMLVTFVPVLSIGLTRVLAP